MFQKFKPNKGSTQTNLCRLVTFFHGFKNQIRPAGPTGPTASQS